MLRVLSLTFFLVIPLLTGCRSSGIVNIYNKTNPILFETLKKNWDIELRASDSKLIGNDLIVMGTYNSDYSPTLSRINLKTGDIAWEHHLNSDLLIEDVNDKRIVVCDPKERDLFYSIFDTKTGEIINEYQKHGSDFLSEFFSGKLLLYNHSNIICFDELTGRELWKFISKETLDEIFPLIVLDEKLFMIIDRGNEFCCLDIDKGNKLWDFKDSNQTFTEFYIECGNVLVLSEQGMLYSLNAQNGNSVWKREFRIKNEINKFFGCPEFSLSVIGEKIYFFPSAKELFCLDAKTGKEYWRFSIDFNGLKDMPSFVMPKVHKGKVYFATISALYCLDDTTGKLLWEFDTITGNELKNRHNIQDLSKEYFDRYGESYIIVYALFKAGGVNLFDTFEIMDNNIFYIASKKMSNEKLSSHDSYKIIYCIDLLTVKQNYSLEFRKTDKYFPYPIGGSIITVNDKNVYFEEYGKLTSFELPSDTQPSLDSSK